MRKLVRWICVLLLATLLVPGQPPKEAEANEEAPGFSELGGIGGLDLGSLSAIATRAASSHPVASLRVANRPVKIILISSGVQESVLPQALADRSSEVWGGPDLMGYGTYAASVMFQIVPGLEIRSLNVYPNGKLDLDRLHWAWRWAEGSASSYDAVLSAVPPHEFLDPISAALESGEWEAMVDSMHDSSLKVGVDPLFGVPLDQSPFDERTATRPRGEYLEMARFRWVMNLWNDALYRIGQLKNKGVPVILPAGDLGPNNQTVFGLANLPEVITVGGTSSGQPSPTSASGPSIDGKIKPDLVAPTGLVGVMPASSKLANSLRAKDLLNPSLVPEWPQGGSPSTDARTRADSTLSSAAVVAGIAGTLAAEGLRNVDKIRGALYAASQPITGVPVWRQGAGSLQFAPDKNFADTTPLIPTFADLGLEPVSGDWSKEIPIIGASLTTSTAGTEFVLGVDVLGRSTVARVETSPLVTVTASSGGLRVSAGTGMDNLQHGMFCGYVSMTVTEPLPSGKILPTTTPLCLINGFRPVARSFYIHNQSAKDNTFTLSPALPPGASLLDRPLHLLPINPTGQNIFMKITENGVACGVKTCDGHARFANIPPGYYNVRQFSDYRMPTLPKVKTRNNDSDLGSISYTGYKSLLLPDLCQLETNGTLRDEEDRSFDNNGDWSESYRKCNRDALQDAVTTAWNSVTHTSQPVTLIDDDPTGGFRLMPEVQGVPVLIHTGFLRKMVDTVVSSRYIDMLAPCKTTVGSDIKYRSLQTAKNLALKDLPAMVSGANDWQHDCPQTLTEQILNSSDTSVGVRLGHYRFALSQPNYSAHMSLNFAYDLANAVILVVVNIGDDWNVGWVGAAGSYRVPAGGGTTSIDLSSLGQLGTRRDHANFEFDALPRGVDHGDLYVLMLPTSDAPTAYAKLEDNEAENKTFSFEMRTWTPVAWPAVDFDDRSKSCDKRNCGHTFAFRPNYKQWTTTAPPVGGFPVPSGQIKDQQCRTIRNSTDVAYVCEDWDVFVQVPTPGDAATSASFLDLADVSLAGSTLTVTSILESAGPKLGFFNPPDNDTGQFFTVPAFHGYGSELLARYAGIVPGKVNGSFFGEMVIPRDVFRGRTQLEVCIADGPSVGPTRTSNCGGTGKLWPGLTLADLELPARVVTPSTMSPFESWTSTTVTVASFNTLTPTAAPIDPYVPYEATPAVTLGGWNTWGTLGGYLTHNTDSAHYGSGIVVAVRGRPHDVWVREYSSGSWTGGFEHIRSPEINGSSSGNSSFAPAVSSPMAEVFDVFVVASDGNLWVKRKQLEIWTQGALWTQLDKPPCLGLDCNIKSSPDATSMINDESAVEERTDVIVRGPGGGYWIKTRLPLLGWQPWVSIGAPPLGASEYDPSIVRINEEMLAAFVVGADGNIWQRSLDLTTQQWGLWSLVDTPLGAPMSSGVDATANGDRLEIYGRGADRVIWYRRWDVDARVWSIWEPIPGMLSDESPSAVLWPTGRSDVFIVNPADKTLMGNWRSSRR